MVLGGRDYICTGHVWVQLNARGLNIKAREETRNYKTAYTAIQDLKTSNRVVLVSRILSGSSVVFISFVA